MICRKSVFHAAIGCLLLVAASPGLRAADDDEKCTDCHDTWVGLAHAHPPVADASCDVCHEQPDPQEHEFRLTAEGKELCTSCHDDPKGKVVHAPAADGCTLCHDPHASKHAKLLTADEADLCRQCHGSVTEGDTFVHGPVAAGACTACHRAHASDTSKLLRAEGAALCSECHDDLSKRIQSDRNVHAPVSDSCTSCHDAHGGTNRMFTSAAIPDLCYSCHDDIRELGENATVRHRGMVAGRGCETCHDPHASNQPGMLLKPNAELCMKCHNKALKTPAGRLDGLTAVTEKDAVQHGPITEGDCTSCHTTVHGGERYRLLGAAYPATFYAAFKADAYALCFDCHDADAFTSAETDDATAFRNGRQNLHYVHVDRTKGRTCGACHDVHASRQEHLIANAVPFGQWQLPIGYDPLPTGGACRSGCHRPYRYDRENPVRNLPDEARPAAPAEEPPSVASAPSGAG